MKKANETQPKSSLTPKRPYTTPHLVEFGHVLQLTQGTGSKNVDMVSGRRKN